MIDADFTVVLGKFRLAASFHDKGLTLLTGENGSGKSTFLNALAGFIPLESGSVGINGRDITDLEVQRRGLVYITSNSYIGNLTVERHISWPGKPDVNPGKVSDLMESFGINFRGKVRNLSMGQRIRVSLATAFYRKPEGVLIDEALSNLSDPLEVYGEIAKLSNAFGTDVIIVAHTLPGLGTEHSYVLKSGNMSREY